MYWYDNHGEVMEESDDHGALQKVYFYLNGAKLAYLQGTSSLYFYYGDHLGTTRMMTDGSGNVCYDADYFPWGDEDHVFTNTCSQNYKFTAKERDPDLGVYNMGARFFQDAMGRFYSPDPLLSSARPDNPQTWNRYAYALNNPTRIFDPTGLYDWDSSAGGSLSDSDLNAIAGDKEDSRHKWAQQALQFRSDFRSALASASVAGNSSVLSQSQQNAVSAAVAAYGSEGDGNGVTVGREQGHGADTLLMKDDTISVKFGSLSGDRLTATVAHEGVHIEQANAWLDGGESSVGNLNHFQREIPGWEAGSFVAQALGMKNFAPYNGSRDMQVWNKGWKAADIETLRAKGIGNILDYMSRTPELKQNMLQTYSQEHSH